MSAFIPANIPTDTPRKPATLEQLIVWAALILKRFTAKKTFLRRTGLAEESICSVDFFTDADGNDRVQVFVVMPAILTGGAVADWMQADQIATTDIPDSYK